MRSSGGYARLPPKQPAEGPSAQQREDASTLSALWLEGFERLELLEAQPEVGLELLDAVIERGRLAALRVGECGDGGGKRGLQRGRPAAAAERRPGWRLP